MQKTPYVFPIIGGRKVEHLHANIEALDIALTPEHIKRIEGAVPFELGFPTAFVVSFIFPFMLSSGDLWTDIIGRWNDLQPVGLPGGCSC